MPHVDIPGITRHFTPVYKDEDYSPVALAKKYAMYTAPDEHVSHGYSAGFIRAYRDISMNAGPAYRKILEQIRDRPDQPFIFHCTAGKDRTGVWAALILRLCGVDDEAICWEYGLTERGLGDWRSIVVERLMKGAGGGIPNGPNGETRKGLTREEAERIVGSRPENMQVFLKDVVDGEFGGAEQYLQDYCQFTPEDVDKIRGNLLVEEDAVLPPENRRIRVENGPTGIAQDTVHAREEKVMAG